MIIRNLKINGYGNLKNKEIELKDGINIIYGENESGKSTILKFILNMLYGTSKNKKGRDISDFEKFKPWEGEEFSGKLKYQLDDGKTYEVYREFNKKNPIIYNEEMEDISKSYKIDKNKGNEFFFEQTKIDEELFISTTAVMQQEVAINKNTQNLMLQKITNLASTGNDNISYKKAITKLNKKQLEEIGTDRSQDRPINKIKQNLVQLINKKSELNLYQDKKYEIEQDKNKLEEQISQTSRKLEIIKEINRIKNNSKINNEKININKEMIKKEIEKISELDKNISKLQEDYNNIKQPVNKKIDVKKYVLLIIIAIILLIIPIVQKKYILLFVPMLIIIVSVIIYIIENNKIKLENAQRNSDFKIEKSKKNNEIEKIKSEKQIIENEKKSKEEDIEKITRESLIKTESELANIKMKYKLNNIEKYENVDEYDIRLEQDKIAELKIQLHKIELDKSNIIPQLENLSKIEEEIKVLEDEYSCLVEKNNNINLVKETLEKAYEIMKKDITPRFTNILSNTVSIISNNKYKSVIFNSEEGLVVELENGKYISADLLSTGTMDQLYLSLRLAIVNEIVEENIPIILDESFAYYDSNRLENMLKYINNNVKNQTIILTCNKRERDILGKNNIEYNYIKLD